MMDALLDHFINYLRIERGLSDNTVQAYSGDLMRFSEYLTRKNCTPVDISSQDISDYIITLAKDFSPRSIARNISSIKTFFRFLTTEGHIENNPARLVETPRMPRRLPDFLNKGEVSSGLQTRQYCYHGSGRPGHFKGSAQRTPCAH